MLRALLAAVALISLEADAATPTALAKEKSISFEEARDQIMAAREQAAQWGGATKEGDTKTLSSGRKVVFTNGKWQLAE